MRIHDINPVKLKENATATQEGPGVGLEDLLPRIAYALHLIAGFAIAVFWPVDHAFNGSTKVLNSDRPQYYRQPSLARYATVKEVSYRYNSGPAKIHSIASDASSISMNNILGSALVEDEENIS
ncbi:hypothetical protein C8Q75DRAFT_803001 [Abortiporus biennis]|nr:hypothetical protein C8Q75DRAFT_803001 [Abortiporus biennis]